MWKRGWGKMGIGFSEGKEWKLNEMVDERIDEIVFQYLAMWKKKVIKY